MFEMKKLIFLAIVSTVTGQMTLPPLPGLPGLPGFPPPRMLPDLSIFPGFPSPKKILESLPTPPLLPDILNITGLPSPQKLMEIFMNISLPNLPGLPTPQKFLELFLNVTTGELNDLVSDFNFEQIPAKDVIFTLYLNESSVILNSTNLEYVKTDRPIKFLAHGWGTEGDFFRTFTKNYNEIGITNVIGIDWSVQSKKSYIHSARSSKKIGEIVGDFILNLVKNDTKLLKNVHLLGHSLGAHIFGFTGKYLKNVLNGSTVGRITALDAAAPLFEFPLRVSDDRRLARTDADFVDSIHTNVGFFGFLSPFADADFYVNNGGPVQPECIDINVFESLVCSHSKSFIMYSRTITSKNYLASSCENPLRAIANFCNDKPKTVMGEHARSIDKGEFVIQVDRNEQPLPTII